MFSSVYTSIMDLGLDPRLQDVKKRTLCLQHDLDLNPIYHYKQKRL